MPPARERHWPGIVVSYAALLTVVATLAAFLYDTTAPADRALVVRLAIAVVVAAMVIHLRSYFRGDPRWDPPSALEEALGHAPPAATLDPGFVKLRSDVKNAVASRSFFDRTRWPRLAALAGARGRDEPPPAPRLPLWQRRGPPLRDLTANIERIAGRRQ